MTINGASATDVARAARLVAAISADDQRGVTTLFTEANDTAALRGLVLALAARHVLIAGEYYDTDRQQILDMHAMEAMNYTENADD